MSVDQSVTKYGDLVQLVSPTNKIFIFALEPGGQLQTHRGVLNHDDLVGQSWGCQVFTHLGSSYILLPPGLSDILKETRRNTQIMYPKDIGYVLLTLGIGPGKQVVEAGTGSGALTTALAWAVGPDGQVFSYDNRPEMQNLARKNLEKVGLAERVTFKIRDISEGFEEKNIDSLFLDVQNPHDYLGQVKETLKPGGFFGAIQPTTNQVTRLLHALYRFEFGFIDVCEIILRFYKPVPERLRPTDRMVAHTGFLIFARPMLAISSTDDLASHTAEFTHKDDLLDENDADWSETEISQGSKSI
jgi:tRNA (adenine57-N1/adenine58-N1)-methyltransferase